MTCIQKATRLLSLLVTVWAKRNYHFPLQQNSISLQNNNQKKNQEWRHYDVITEHIFMTLLIDTIDLTYVPTLPSSFIKTRSTVIEI